MKHRVFVAIACVALLAAVSSTFAGRPDKEWKDWFGHFSGGYSLAQGDLGDFVDDDWTIAGGATYWPETWPVGLDLELAYNDFGINRQTLDDINESLPEDSDELTGGGVEIWSLTTDFIWSPGTNRVSPYLAGGVGVYWLETQLTSPGVLIYPPICGFWWCYPGGAVPGDIVKASESSTELGLNLGIGLNMEMKNGSQLYFEAKYHWVDSDPQRAEYVPITIGYRW